MLRYLTAPQKLQKLSINATFPVGAGYSIVSIPKI